MMEEVYIKTEPIDEIMFEDTPEIKLERNEEQVKSEPLNEYSNCVLTNEMNDSKSVKSPLEIDIVPPSSNLESTISTCSAEMPTEQIEIKGKVYENGKRNRLACSQCDKTFQNRANLKNHLKFVHSGTHSVECSQCFRTFKSHGHLRSHLDSVHAVIKEVNCHICSKVFLNEKRLKNHVYYTHPQPEEQVTCPVCSKIYKSQYNLRIHMRQVHPEGESVPCPYCDKSFKVDMLLQRHIKWSHPNDGMIYKCQQCFKVLPSLACYKKHVENTHNALLRATCKLCNRIFKSKKSLDRHLTNVHNGKEVKPYVPSKFICTYCERSFESNISLLCHTQKYHLRDESVSSSTVEMNNCEVCNKQYSDNAALQRHLASVHSIEKATCSICLKEFKSAINLQSHMRITHAPPEATQTCGTCNKTFKCALHLRMHINAVHTDGEFKCDICDKHFTSLKYLKKHEKTHVQTREHPCELCGKMFKSIFAVNKHRKFVHNSVKCGYCNTKQVKIDEHLLKCPKKIVRVESFVQCETGFDSSELQQHTNSCDTEMCPIIIKIEQVESD